MARTIGLIPKEELHPKSEKAEKLEPEKVEKTESPRKGK